MTLRPLILALGALLLSAAAPDPAPAPLRLLETITPQGLQEASPGAIVSVAILARPAVAILAGDVQLDATGERHTLARGDVLQAGGATGVAGVPEAIFCEPAPVRAVDTVTGRPAAGAAAPLYCLFDADKDGRFDHAIRIGGKGDAGAPFAIPPVDYGVIPGRRVSEDSVARLRYVGPVESPSSIAFDLEAYANGRMHAVPQRRTFIPVTKLPAYAIIGVAVVTVLTYDPTTRVATIRMDHDLAPGQIVLPEFSHGH